IEYCTVFEPVYCATVRLQNECLTMGDFFFICLEEIKNSQMAITLVAAMKNRQKLLVEGTPFLAALNLDPRINYVQSDLISDEQKNIGLQHLLQLWSKMSVSLDSSETFVATPSSSQTLAEETTENLTLSRVEAMLRKKEANPENRKIDMEKKLKEMPLRCRLSSTASVIEYFYNIRSTDPMIYSLAKVPLSVPRTQVSTERAFSALGLILTDKRMRLSDKNLANVIVKLYEELFE
ncbi:uncharacterized protein LOC125959347, partial [Anopheles darlingi]|uniref:uncharacterized protein LOC125959347 n=1 Tax=Anopheles darlingi TaxID=43151 RepID=UPI0021002A3F